MNEIYPLDRHVHGVVARVFEIQKVAFDVGDLHVPQAAVLRDAVIDMHDEIVGLQLFKIEQRALGARAPAPMRSRLAENFLFAVDVKTVGLQNDAGGNLPFHDRGAVVRPFCPRWTSRSSVASGSKLGGVRNPLSWFDPSRKLACDLTSTGTAHPSRGAAIVTSEPTSTAVKFPSARSNASAPMNSESGAG